MKRPNQPARRRRATPRDRLAPSEPNTGRSRPSTRIRRRQHERRQSKPELGIRISTSHPTLRPENSGENGRCDRPGPARATVVLSADVYTRVSETHEHGYPNFEHLNRLLANEIIWAPAVDGTFVLSTRGDAFALQPITDVSIGYLHDRDTAQLTAQSNVIGSWSAAHRAARRPENTQSASDNPLT
ncbi:encapsulin [Mycolicibacterium sp. S2-37]|nr:encapsulin [Mycolicibacterium sp. S2-37]